MSSVTDRLVGDDHPRTLATDRTKTNKYTRLADEDSEDGLDLDDEDDLDHLDHFHRSNDEDDDDDNNDNDENATDLPGVQMIEATTVAWTTAALVVAYVLIWLTYFVEGLLTSTTAILAPYVTSAFALHSFTPTVGILSSVVGGVTNLTLAKVLDVFGRPQGLVACVALAGVGLVLMAVCGSVETYAAAQVLQTVGNSGIQYSLTVFVADTSSLRNRGLMQSLVTSPNLVTCFLAGPLAAWFLGDGKDSGGKATGSGPGWRAAFGSFAVLVPAVTLPLFVLLLKNYLRAKKLGLVEPTSADVPVVSNGRTLTQSIVHYGHQFDALGLLLLSLGVALVLLPFNLYALQGWGVGRVVATLAVGALLLVLFGVWERRYAAVPFVPYAALLDRTVLGACVLSATIYLSFWSWNSFFSSYLQVVAGLSVEGANYVVQSYTVCAVLCSIAVGLLIHCTGRFKPVCLCVGIPLSVVGSAVMIFLAKSHRSDKIVLLVLCQICTSIAAGTIMVCDEVAILAAASHQQAAVCLALLGMFGNVGGAVGLTVAAALWQNIFPRSLQTYLPADELTHLDEIFADIAKQLSYPMGSPARIAIQHAYDDAQVGMLTVGTAVWVIGLVAVLFWRNINVIGIQQNKGHVW